MERRNYDQNRMNDYDRGTRSRSSRAQMSDERRARGASNRNDRAVGNRNRRSSNGRASNGRPSNNRGGRYSEERISNEYRSESRIASQDRSAHRNGMRHDGYESQNRSRSRNSRRSDGANSGREQDFYRETAQSRSAANRPGYYSDSYGYRQTMTPRQRAEMRTRSHDNAQRDQMNSRRRENGAARPDAQRKGRGSASQSSFEEALSTGRVADARRRANARYRQIDQGLGGGFLPTRLILFLLIAFAVLAVVALGVRFAVSFAKPEISCISSVAQEVKTRVDSNKLSAEEVASRLEEQGVDDTYAQEAGNLAQGDNRFQMMAQHADELGKEGTDVTNKLVTLAVSDPQAIDYVEDFGEKYPQETAEAYMESVKKGEVPHLYQWDQRWGYITYSGTALGCTGCGPTSMSMVYMGLTGKNDKSPADMAQLASDGGYETDYDGTSNDFFTDVAYQLGLYETTLDVDSQSLTEALETGQVVICNVGPGDFTLNGHFIVLTGIDDDGQLIVNDPYSSVNSSQTWDLDQVVAQSIALYAYSAAD